MTTESGAELQIRGVRIVDTFAEAFGMRVIYYDLAEKLTLGNARRYRSLDALLAEADVISLHVDGRPENKNLIGAAQFARMKDGVLFINLSRGHVVEIDALSNALKSGKVYGAAIDVFPEEPRTNDEPFVSSLKGLKNLILTPHIGGSTEEAQESIGQFASEHPRCPTQCHFGEKDHAIPQSEVDAVRRANPDVPIYMYPAGHGFSCDARASYDADSAALARRRTLEWFAEYVG